MSEMHGVALSPEERGLMKIWSAADPPDTFELERHSRIKQAQGNSNPFVP